MKIGIVEDHRMFRDFLRDKGVRGAGHEVLWEAGSLAEAERLLGARPPEVLLLDLSLPDGDGYDLAERTLQRLPRLLILVLTSHCDEYTISRLLQSGVQGFVDKNEQPVETIAQALVALQAGRTYYSEAVERIRQHLREDSKAFTKLFSPRELEVLGLVGAGFSDEDIGRRLALSTSTVQWHRKRIQARLGLESTRELMRYALQKGITRLPLILPPGANAP